MGNGRVEQNKDGRKAIRGAQLFSVQVAGSLDERGRSVRLSALR